MSWTTVDLKGLQKSCLTLLLSNLLLSLKKNRNVNLFDCCREPLKSATFVLTEEELSCSTGDLVLERVKVNM